MNHQTRKLHSVQDNVNETLLETIRYLKSIRQGFFPNSWQKQEIEKTIEKLCTVVSVSVYDYTNQSWTRNGRYVRCGHPEEVDCHCFGRLHEDEELKENANCHFEERVG